jgi:hypothetical protein
MKDPMRTEWQAWQDVNAECKLLGIDMNEHKYDCLIKAIKVWGEQLAALRDTQSVEAAAKALAMYQEDYQLAKKRRTA